MPHCQEILPLAASSETQNNPIEEKIANTFASPFIKPLKEFFQGTRGKTKLNEKEVTILPSLLQELDSSLSSDSWKVLNFDALVEAASLKIWTMLRAHLRQINRYHEEQEKLYRNSVRAQVQAYLSWVGTAFQVASIGTGICSIGMSLVPGTVSTEACRAITQLSEKFHWDWLNNITKQAVFDHTKFPEAAQKALEATQGIFTSCTRIHDNYSGADRVSAQGTSEITKIQLERVSRHAEESRGERASVLQTLQQMYQQESEARKAISR